MKLSTSVLGAILLGITVQTTSCVGEEELPSPTTANQEKGSSDNGPKYDPNNCPACGMG
ncbi:chryseobasin-related MNIO class RiPP peptide [Rufibacter immobilis]|uniref:chryseobasin-related MNIO class RiPP peptide n=1 Tax=Rufibacter immobilis TaxID=1348778 RepID=UPI0035E755C5